MRAHQSSDAEQEAEDLRLATLAGYRILDTSPEPAFDEIAFAASHVCGTPVALVSLVGQHRQWFKARVGFEACETPLGQSVCTHAMRQADLLVIPDLALDSRTRDNPLVTGEPGIRFYAGAPLVTPEGIGIGALCVIDSVPRAGGLTPAQERVLKGLADQVMSQLELRRLLQDRDAAIAEKQREAAAIRAHAATSEGKVALLLASGRFSRLAQRAGRIGVYSLDVETGMLNPSEEFCRVYGLVPAAEMPATDIEALIVPEDVGLASSTPSRLDGSAELDVEYRIRRADDGALRHISRRAEFIRDDAGRVTHMVGTVRDVTDRARFVAQQAALIELGDRLREARDVGGIASVASAILERTLGVHAAGLGFLGGDGRMEQTPYVEHLRRGEAVVVTDVATDPRTAAGLGTLDTSGVRALIALPLMVEGQLAGIAFANSAQPREWTPDEVTFARAVADRAHAAFDMVTLEAQQRILNGELSHRLKNTMAMVQAIARQTLGAVADRQPVVAFEHRIKALARAHDVLTQRSWTAARIRDLVQTVLGTFEEPQRFLVSGPDLALGPRTALSLAMLLHEMATNALKYGALTRPEGVVRLEWRVGGEGEDAEVILEWRERGGPPAEEPRRRGFGSRLIRTGLVGTGGVELRYDAEGFSARMTANLGQMQRS